MKLKVVRWGDDLAVRLTGAEAERLGVREGETVEVTPKAAFDGQMEDGVVPAMPGRQFVDGIPVYTMSEMVAEAHRLGPEAEPETVDWGPDRGSEIIDDDADPY